MALRYGFYHSDPVTGPRTYNAEDISRLLDGIITEGVFDNFLEAFKLTLPETVSSDDGFELRIGSGKAWYNGTWSIIDELDDVVLNVAYGSENNRVDEVILEVNTINKTNRLFLLEGIPGQGILDPATGVPALPYAPKISGHISPDPIPESGYVQELTPDGNPSHNDPEEGIYWYPLYYLIIPKNMTKETYNKNDIVIRPIAHKVVNCPIEHMDIDILYTVWRKAYNDWLSDRDAEFQELFRNANTEFQEWFQHLHDELDTKQVTHLQNQIDKIIRAGFGEQYSYSLAGSALNLDPVESSFGDSVTATFNEETSTLNLTSKTDPSTENIRFETDGEDLIIK